MARFVDRDEIDSRYFEKPYYLLPDGDEADEGYTVLRDAFAKTKKVAIGQLIMHGREHLVGITAHKKGLMLVILRYADELRKPEPYFDTIDTKADAAVQLAVDLIEEEAGKFEPQKMPNEYANAVHELVQAKVEQRAPEVEIETEKREAPKVVNIMDALKKSMQAKGQTKVRDSVRKRMGKDGAEGSSLSSFATITGYDAAYRSLACTGVDKLPAHFAAEVPGVLFISRLDYNARQTVEHAKARKLDFNLLRFAKPQVRDGILDVLHGLTTRIS